MFTRMDSSWMTGPRRLVLVSRPATQQQLRRSSAVVQDSRTSGDESQKNPKKLKKFGMEDNPPKIRSLKPVVLPDNRRVTMELVVDNLPSVFSGSFGIDLYDTPPASKLSFSAEKDTKIETNLPGDRHQSQYPDIELSIFNSDRQEVASLLIVEHKEPFTALTLHLRSPQANDHYTARAKMTHNNETLEVVEVPFTLEPAD
jgi:hypothetical protein